MEFLLSLWCCSPYYALVPSRDGEIRSLSRLLSIFFSLSLVLRRLIFLASDVERGEKKQLSTVVAPAVIVMKNSLPIFFEFFIRFSSSVLYYTKGWACPPCRGSSSFLYKTPGGGWKNPVDGNPKAYMSWLRNRLLYRLIPFFVCSNRASWMPHFYL